MLRASRRFAKDASLRVIGFSARPDGGALGAALNVLGLGCYDFHTALACDAPAWAATLRHGTPVDADAFTGFDALVGQPATAAWRAVLSAVPETTKVVVLVEDASPSSALQRFRREIIIPYVATAHRLPPWVARLSSFVASSQQLAPLVWPDAIPPPAGDSRTDRLRDAAAAPGRAGATPEELEAASLAFLRDVRQAVPQDRLLLWRLSDGWAPLSDFLDVPKAQRPSAALLPKPDHGERYFAGVVANVRSLAVAIVAARVIAAAYAGAAAVTLVLWGLWPGTALLAALGLEIVVDPSDGAWVIQTIDAPEDAATVGERGSDDDDSHPYVPSSQR